MLSTNSTNVLVDDRQAQLRLDASRSTLYRLRRAGILPSVRIGGSIRYRLLDIERIVREGTGAYPKGAK
jgi:predicted DNA-binding transcriptional regulator AlpA